MKDIQKEQLEALDTIGAALAKLEHSTDAFEIEAHVYTIIALAKRSYKRLHALNGNALKVWHPDDATHCCGRYVKTKQDREHHNNSFHREVRP